MALKDDLVKGGMWAHVADKLTTSPSFTTPAIGAATGATLTLTGGVRLPVTTVAAAGANQGNAAALSEGINIVTGADDTKGVILPTAVAGMQVIIKVGDGADLKVYPATGAAINAVAANGAITVVDDVCFMLVATSATQWYTLPLLPS
jgi:hypothetical protein